MPLPDFPCWPQLISGSQHGYYTGIHGFQSLGDAEELVTFKLSFFSDQAVLGGGTAGGEFLLSSTMMAQKPTRTNKWKVKPFSFFLIKHKINEKEKLEKNEKTKTKKEQSLQTTSKQIRKKSRGDKTQKRRYAIKKRKFSSKKVKTSTQKKTETYKSFKENTKIKRWLNSFSEKASLPSSELRQITARTQVLRQHISPLPYYLYWVSQEELNTFYL